ncbi:MAG: carbon-nitrogen hydrolase family protein [Alphaproteobacteria bacterium]
MTLRVACVQLNSGAEIAPNIAISTALIRQAHGEGAALVATPEVSNLCEMRSGRAAEKAFDEANEPALQAYRELAAELGIWLLAGSLVVRLEDDPRFANRSFLIDSSGAIAARYDKIHMFDVDLEGGESYRESARFRPGERAVIAPSPWGDIGMTICYDLRFAYLYRHLAQAGARILTVPSSFARPTGRAHWHVLLRARAIETGCFVMAPAQCGDHEDGRKTYGHSLIVSPWGEILAEAGEEPGVILADLDFDAVDTARSMVPSLGHDRVYSR